MNPTLQKMINDLETNADTEKKINVVITRGMFECGFTTEFSYVFLSASGILEINTVGNTGNISFNISDMHNIIYESEWYHISCNDFMIALSFEP